MFGLAEYVMSRDAIIRVTTERLAAEHRARMECKYNDERAELSVDGEVIAVIIQRALQCLVFGGWGQQAKRRLVLGLWVDA